MKFLIKFLLRVVPRHHLHKVAHLGLCSIAWFYAGKKFEDPITGKKYRKLLPYGRLTPRKNALASHSLSLERHRLFWLFLQNETDFFQEKHKVLHLAPEYCFLKIFRKLPNIEYVTADLCSPWVDYHFDVHKIPFEDASFDVVFANHLLEHVSDDAKVLSEFYRVMKPKGFGIFMVPMNTSAQKTQEDPTITDPKMREKLYGQDDHVRLYGLDYPKRLQEAGFEVLEYDMQKSLGESKIERYCLDKGDRLYLCLKK